MANKILVILVMILFSFPAFAAVDEDGSQPDSNSTFSIGPGVVLSSKPYAGMDTKVYPIPMIYLVMGRFYISGGAAGYRALADENWTFDAIAKWRFDGYEEDDSDDLDGMHERRMSIDIGGEFAISGDWGTIKTSFVTDSLGRHDGQELRLSYAKPFNVEKLRITPSAGVVWQSNNLTDYYYGVRTDEARAGRPAYNAGDAINWFTGIYANYQHDDKWSFIGGITYYWLDSEIHDSPIVSKSHTISILAGAMYKF